MNPRRAAKIKLNHHGGLHMTEQFKLVTNAQESKIFKTNATASKIKCSNNFSRRYSVEMVCVGHLGCLLKRAICGEIFALFLSKQLFPSAKITLQMTHSDWLNLVTHTAWWATELDTSLSSSICQPPSMNKSTSRNRTPYVELCGQPSSVHV